MILLLPICSSFLHYIKRNIRLYSAKKLRNNDYSELINANKIKLTKNQQLYTNALNDPNVSLVVVMGSAGTGKTFIGCQWGLKQFMCQHKMNEFDENNINIKKMIITRPLIPVSGEEIGFIPGGIVSKMEPWTRPIYDAFLEGDVINRKTLDKYIMDGNIEIIPLAFMRGRTFSNAFIFADEMQNSTPEQMLMLLTRIGNGSKIIISGDLAQSDICKGLTANGLYDFVNKLKKWNINGMNDNSIKIIEFDKEDIRRSKLTSTILDIYKEF
jgi:phosphate starvation-inducible PhoH-like protein